MRIETIVGLLVASAIAGGVHVYGSDLNQSAVAEAALRWNDASPHREGFVDSAGTRINFLDWGGDGPPLILIHGIINSPHIFDDLAPLLRDRFRVIAYARRGHGHSDAPTGPYDSKTLVGDLVHLLDHFGIVRANLLGWSMGGNEVTEFSGTYPERIDKIVYLEGGYDWSDPTFFKAFADMLASNGPSVETLRSFDALKSWYHAVWIGRKVPWTPALEAFLRDSVRIRADGAVIPVPSLEVFGALFQTLGTWQRDYSKVRAPALAIYASSFFPDDGDSTELAFQFRSFEKNAVAPFRQASIERIRRELNGAKVIELSGRTHMSIGVTEPDVLAATIKTFLLNP